MSRAEETLLELAVEQRLLQEVCELVRSWEGRPPLAALDAVLRGQRRPGVSRACRPAWRLHTPARWRPGADHDPARGAGVPPPP